ncbi:epimerase [Buchananella felis]|uniref:epimerase n=1 Tax=Buchananella felis TaxID=3231492 RepID=UPI003528D4D7
MSKRIVVAGASGLIGGELVAALRGRGDAVTCLVRREPRGPFEARWEPSRGVLDAGVLAGADAVVVLNGASIARLPWTAKYRRELAASRLAPVRTVVRALAELPGGTQASTAGGATDGSGGTAGGAADGSGGTAGGAADGSGGTAGGAGQPLLVSASAVGFYGSQPGAELTESGAPGATFLAGLCQRWEAQALAAAPGTDVALLRTAPVVHRESFLRPLIAITRLGLAGPLAGGRQVWPWISLADEVGAILHVIDHRLTGPVNLCGPTPATANDVGRAVARLLRRPFWLPAPAFGLRMALGREAADALLLADANVRPRALLDSGFAFTHPTVSEAIQAALE